MRKVLPAAVAIVYGNFKQYRVQTLVNVAETQPSRSNFEIL